MIRKVARLFVIKTRVEAYMIIYALALGATERGRVYLTLFPGFGGKLLFANRKRPRRKPIPCFEALP